MPVGHSREFVFAVALELAGASWTDLEPAADGHALTAATYLRDTATAIANAKRLTWEGLDWRDVFGALGPSGGRADVLPGNAGPADVDWWYASHLVGDRRDAVERIVYDIHGLIQSGDLGYVAERHQVPVEKVRAKFSVHESMPVTAEWLVAASAGQDVVEWERTTDWPLALRLAVRTWKTFWRADVDPSTPRTSTDIRAWLKRITSDAGMTFSDNRINSIQWVSQHDDERSGGARRTP